MHVAARLRLSPRTQAPETPDGGRQTKRAARTNRVVVALGGVEAVTEGSDLFLQVGDPQLRGGELSPGDERLTIALVQGVFERLAPIGELAGRVLSVVADRLDDELVRQRLRVTQREIDDLARHVGARPDLGAEQLGQDPVVFDGQQPSVVDDLVERLP
ncbi:MAG TPA: hypothetical protein VGU73_12795, partial [Acidimicrobiia bacterium]|nr:hypothetical protein [Acidimicrobiia bacterium]